jgi:hypothetical protein
MAITRAGIEAELVGKMRGKLANGFYTLSVLTDGGNPDLNGPIRRAVLTLGGTVAGELTVADADLAPFSGWDVERLLDAARVEALKTCLDQCAFVDVQADQDEMKLSQLAGQIQAEITYLEQRLSEPYGLNVNPSVVAPMAGRDMPNDPFLPCSTRTPWNRWPYP